LESREIEMGIKMSQGYGMAVKEAALVLAKENPGI
jgi:hypothetical protein